MFLLYGSFCWTISHSNRNETRIDTVNFFFHPGHLFALDIVMHPGYRGVLICFDKHDEQKQLK